MNPRACNSMIAVSIRRPFQPGIARCTCKRLGHFPFPADFVVVDYEVNYRVPLILDKESTTGGHYADRRFKDVCELKSDDYSSPTSAIVEKFDSLVGEIIKQKEEVKKISDPVARRKACFTSNLKNFRIIHQGRVIHSPQIASFQAFSNPPLRKKMNFPLEITSPILKREFNKETLKSYLNPLFEDDEEIISIEVSRQISPKVNSEPSIDDMSFLPKELNLESLPKDDFDNDDDLFEMDSNNDEWKRLL
ncbi:hypothetical protein Tco_0878489 [Tanacetum coccineum]|uniref:Uncharacterized protein n=1 Tax=Tanacetum coccineum TaxID=301880 RepID=A0ABQ5C169_9ASTR